MGTKAVVSGRASISAERPTDTEIAYVTVNEVPVDAVDSAGRFFSQVDILPGENTFDVTAVDTLGRSLTTHLAIRGTTASQDVDFGQLSDITATFEDIYATSSLHEASETLYVDLSLRNNGDFVSDMPLLVGVTRLSDPSITVLGADGLTSDGVPYFDYTSLIDDGRLEPNEFSNSMSVAFHNPLRTQFDYDLVFFGQLNRSPIVTSLPPTESFVDREYSYDVDAVDPDEDPLRFRLLTKPDGMSIDRDSGHLRWTPTPQDVGSHSINILVEDGRGGSTQQDYTITVGTAPPNRPPIITSLPGDECKR